MNDSQLLEEILNGNRRVLYTFYRTHKTNTGAVLGLIIIVGSVWILQLLAKITGIDILENIVSGTSQ